MMLKLLVSLLLLGAACSTELTSNSKLVSTRSVDISTQVAKFSVNLEIQNAGTEATYFVYVLTSDENNHLSYITATDSSKKLVVAPIQYAAARAGYSYYKISFASPVAKGSSQKVTVQYALTGALKAYPAQISQDESQYMLFSTNNAIISPYTVDVDTTTIKTGGKILSQTDGKQSGEKVSYSSTNIAPYTAKSVSIHYENNAAFVVVTSLERTIEVSHWGNVAIEDHVEVVHKGAELKGSFSRLDYQVDRRSKSPIVKVLKAVLPPKSRDIYYRDQIGNISTSTVRNLRDRVEVEMRPRFPLLGGWRTNYILGYNVPSSEFLFYKDSSYALKLPLVSPLFNDLVIESIKVKIILPETSHNIRVVKPYEITRHPDTLHFTYLDTVGRPVINLEKTNLVEYHSQPLTIYYDYTFINILREPIIAVLAFLAVFAVIIVFNRFDFSIARPAPSTTHSKTE